MHARELCAVDLPVVFVENKIDQVDASTLNAAQVELLAKTHHFRLYRTSAVRDFNVNEAFGYLVHKAVKQFPDPTDMAAKCRGASSSKSTEDAAGDDDDDATVGVQPSRRRTQGKKSKLDQFKVNTDGSCALM